MDLVDTIDSSSIRVDNNSKTGSVIDTVRMVLKCNSGAANTYLSRVFMATPEMTTRCGHIKINGKGKPTPVADAKTLIEIIWLLPGKKAHAFRSQSSEKVCRLLGGDLSLVSEIEARHATLQSTEEGRATQDFLLHDDEVVTDEGPVKKRRSDAPFWFELASAEQKRAYVSVMANNEMALEQMELCKTFKNELQSVGQFSGRDRVEFADRMKDIQVRALAAGNMLAAGPSADNSIVAVARPVDDSIDPETGLLVATPKCSESVRGPETSICNEATKMGVKLGEKAGQVGKVVKRLYSERYGAQAAADIPKRDTTFRGKPFSENTYWSRDADLIQEAIRAVRGREEGGCRQR